MISTEMIAKAFDDATREFTESSDYRELLAGRATVEVAREYLGNFFRTHYLSSHIVALCARFSFRAGCFYLQMGKASVSPRQICKARTRMLETC